MKNIFLIVICLCTTITSYSQKTEDCNCLNEKQMIVTNITFKENKSAIEIESHCVSILRLYILNEQGEEYEAFELDCVSERKNNYCLSENIEYLVHKPKGEFLSNSKGKDKFYKIINGKENYYFEITLNSKKEITQIFEWTANLVSE